jgi:hypothetical protein
VISDKCSALVESGGGAQLLLSPWEVSNIHPDAVRCYNNVIMQ